MWRHGDVFIQSCKAIPQQAKKLPHLILARGEITGHAHRITDRGENELFELGDTLFLRVADQPATVTHEEHAPITLNPGVYRVWIQREYTPQGIRRVID